MEMTNFARVFQPIPLRLNYRLTSTIRYLQSLTLGTRGFFLRAADRNTSLHFAGTSGEENREWKTSGTQGTKKNNSCTPCVPMFGQCHCIPLPLFWILKIITKTCEFRRPSSVIIIHQNHYDKSDWLRAFNQFTIACELDMINAISAADIAFNVCLVTNPLGAFSSETKWLNASLLFLRMN